MKQWHDLLPNWAIVLLLTLLIVLNFVASYFGISLILEVSTLMVIPLLMVSYFLSQKVMANIFFTVFVLYFLGVLFNGLDYLAMSSKLSESSFLAVYCLLFFVMIGRLRYIKLDGVVSIYLVLIILASSYFMYIMFATVKDSFSDSVIMTLSLGKGMVLLLLSILAFTIYLSEETVQTILFLIIVCCFVFSDILSFITTMYLHYWLFDGIQKILQGVGLLLLCIYVYNHQELAKSFSKFSSKNNFIIKTFSN